MASTMIRSWKNVITQSKKFYSLLLIISLSLSSFLPHLVRLNTECFSCCEGSECNSLESALKYFPAEIFDKNSSITENKKTDLSKEEENDKNEEVFLQELEKMIEDDEKKIENGEGTNEENPFEVINKAKSTKSVEEEEEETTKAVEVTTKDPTTAEPEETTESTEEPTTLMETTKTETTTESVEDTTENFATTDFTNITTEEIPIVEGNNEVRLGDDDTKITSVNETEDFDGEHHALTGSATSFKYGLSLVVVNIIFIVINSFVS